MSVNPKRQHSVKTFRQLTKYTKDIFSSSLGNESRILNEITLTDDVNAQVNIFNYIFVKCLDVHAPSVTRKIKRPLAPWMNDSLRQAIVERKNVQNKLKLNPHNVLLQQEFKDKKKCVKSSITNAKKNYYKHQLQENKCNTSGVWKVIRDIVPNHKCSTNSPDFDDVLENAAEFNSFFANVGKETFDKSQQALLNYHNSVSQDCDPDLDVAYQFRPQTSGYQYSCFNY